MVNFDFFFGVCFYNIVVIDFGMVYFFDNLFIICVILFELFFFEGIFINGWLGWLVDIWLFVCIIFWIVVGSYLFGDEDLEFILWFVVEDVERFMGLMLLCYCFLFISCVSVGRELSEW